MRSEVNLLDESMQPLAPQVARARAVEERTRNRQGQGHEPRCAEGARAIDASREVAINGMRPEHASLRRVMLTLTVSWWAGGARVACGWGGRDHDGLDVLTSVRAPVTYAIASTGAFSASSRQGTGPRDGRLSIRSSQLIISTCNVVESSSQH